MWSRSRTETTPAIRPVLQDDDLVVHLRAAPVDDLARDVVDRVVDIDREVRVIHDQAHRAFGVDRIAELMREPLVQLRAAHQTDAALRSR